MKNPSTTITLSNISKRFGALDAVSDITVSIKSGEIVGFVGPNGAGKTTTIAMLMGFLRSSKGTVKILDTPITPETAHLVHKRIGFLSGDMVMPTSLTGTQYLEFVAGQNGRNETQFKKLVHQLNPVMDRPLKTLSRGNKQKIALLAALQHEPDVLIMDEPTSGLDPIMQDVFLKTVSQEAARGVTVFMSSHILSEVSSICTRIIFMRSGKFIVDKHIDEITGQIGKHVTITSPEVKRIKKYLPSGTEVISETASQLRIAVPSENIKELLRWLVTKNFTDLTIEERNLDDVFHELYLEPAGGKAR